MKLMWLCNTLIPVAAEKMGIVSAKPESWITGIYEDIKMMENISLIYLYPAISDQKDRKIGFAEFVGYLEKNTFEFDKNQVLYFISILKKYNPDIIHIFGTECPHTYAMVKAASEVGFIDRVVLSIQGMVSVYSKHYNAYLPSEVVEGKTIRDWIKFDSIQKQINNFKKRGVYEELAIKNVHHVIGRTDWDRACVERLNPIINYHVCNETMRPAFYEEKWSLDKCEKHSIFVSQWYTPLKGLHLILEAMGDLVTQYPDIHLYTTGQSFVEKKYIKRIKNSKYRQYCLALIEKYQLKDNITFLGYLDEKSMCNRYLKSNAFVCCSSIENSPNSVGEAMLLGVPTVASDVGGMKNLLRHGEEGFIYPADEAYMLAYYLRMIFEEKIDINKITQKAREHAAYTHNREINLQKLLNIYEEINNSNM